MIPMNMMKKNGGFTLVELIVVMAILAILAGVAVPAYSGYIKTANEAADTTTLAAVKTAAMATYATKGTVTKIVVEDNGASGDTIAVYLNDSTNAETGTATNEDFKAYFNIADNAAFDVTLKYASSATWVAEDDATNNLDAGWNLTPRS
jgi:type IV pilus assembly protein PilA